MTVTVNHIVSEEINEKIRRLSIMMLKHMPMMASCPCKKHFDYYAKRLDTIRDSRMPLP